MKKNIALRFLGTSHARKISITSIISAIRMSFAYGIKSKQKIFYFLELLHMANNAITFARNVPMERNAPFI